jgi:4-amino-4-deoxy-L-arabinose transferase-like glycosyltransferase
VLFPGVGFGEPSLLPATPKPQPPTQDLGLLVVLAAAALLFFLRLGCPLQEPEEPRYAEIPRQMLAEGRFVVPVLHGLPYYDKPPLLYWLVMVSYQAFGAQDWAARLVACAAGFLTVLVTYGWGRAALGPRAALAGALVLCLSGRFVYLGRLLTMNGLLCLWVTAALAAAHLAVRGPVLRGRWWLLSAGCCGLGLLTKGPVALALAAVPVLAFQVLDRRAARPRWRAWAVYVAVAAALAAPWYVAVAVRDPAFVRYFFWRHHVERFVTPFDHEKPAWYYLPDLLLGMLPWTLLLPALVRFLSRRASAARRPAALGFALLAAGWCVLFFSLAGSKRAGYILPALPPLALAMGCYLDAVLAPAVLSKAASEPDAPARAALAGASGSTLGWPRSRSACLGLCAGMTFVALLVGVQYLLPGHARKYAMRGQVQPLAGLAQDPAVPVACYPRGWDSVCFYLRRNDVHVYTPDRRQALHTDLLREPTTLVFIKSGAPFRDFLGQLAPALEFTPQGREGNVAVGLVRPRLDPLPPNWHAQR